MAAFVGRLDIDTSEKDLVDLLEAAGVRVAKCTKLKAKPGVTLEHCCILCVML